MIKLCEMQYKKTKRNSIRLMIVGLPVLYSLIMHMYFALGAHLYSNNYKMSGFFLLLFVSIQFFLGIYINQFIQIDREANNFIHELSTGISRIKIINSKIIFLVMSLITVYMIAIITFIILNTILPVVNIDFSEIFVYFIISFLFQTPVLLIYIYISYQFGLYGVVLVGVINFITTIIIGTTGLGTLIWSYIPSSWGSKFIINIIPSSITHGNLLKLFLEKEVIKVFLFLIIINLFLITIQWSWFSKWDGKSITGEN